MPSRSSSAPKSHRRRAAPCTRCGDVVLIAESGPRLFLGREVGKPTLHLEHADPGPSGEVFDEVDEGCRRPRVVP